MASEIIQNLYGHYTLCVYNAEELSDDQIHSALGKFGEIKKINRSKNLVFIHYCSKEDAVRCFESMKNHPTLKVNPARQKITAQQPSQNSSSQKNSEMFRGDQGRRNDDHFGAGNKQRGSGDFERADDKIPDLAKIYAPETPLDPNAPKAKIVVIANLPIGFKQKNVYEICSSEKEGVKPLHVAIRKINRPPDTEIRYAHVYFKTDDAVSKVVTNLNNFVVNDFTLVVNTVDQLLEKA